MKDDAKPQDNLRDRVEASSTTGALPVAPSMGPTLASIDLPREAALVDNRVVFISAVAVALGLASSTVAQWLVNLINLVTNLSFFGRVSMAAASPAANHLGGLVLVVPVLGGVIVGIMARYGSKAIRGHGIPEAMEQVLTNESRIPPRVLFLKPLSAAISIGTGGPFGAEGPIISTGGALGSLVGQIIHTTAQERKTLLAAGAAAGMTAIFGSPVSAVLLAVELLLYEFRPRSIIPVALASVASMGMRFASFGSDPVFPMGDVSRPGGGALVGYVLLGGLIGVVSVWVTRLVYAVEDAFERLPVHWMWWPALGAVAVGAIGFFEPRTLGVGYDNIENILSGGLAGRALLVLCLLKLASWSLSLGSGTSGGTLAPLFTVGGALGALLGEAAAWAFPGLGVDPRIAGLVGMAAIFAGASRALLASVVFAFETTRQPMGLLPLLGGGTMAYLISCYFMRNTIMTEKIARRGVNVPSEYSSDPLEQVFVRDIVSKEVVSIRADSTLTEVRAWLDSRAPGSHHQGFPVLDKDGRLAGVLTRRDLLDPSVTNGVPIGSLVKRPLAVIYPDCTVRQARDHMVHKRVGRLPVVSREDRWKVIGMVSRSDVLSAYRS